MVVHELMHTLMSVRCISLFVVVRVVCKHVVQYIHGCVKLGHKVEEFGRGLGDVVCVYTRLHQQAQLHSIIFEIGKLFGLVYGCVETCGKVRSFALCTDDVRRMQNVLMII